MSLRVFLPNRFVGLGDRCGAGQRVTLPEDPGRGAVALRGPGAYLAVGLAGAHDEACLVTAAGGDAPWVAADGAEETWHLSREGALEPPRPMEDAPTATTKMAIVAARRRPAVNHRACSARIATRAPFAPDIASNAQPAHMRQRYQRLTFDQETLGWPQPQGSFGRGRSAQAPDSPIVWAGPSGGGPALRRLGLQGVCTRTCGRSGQHFGTGSSSRFSGMGREGIEPSTLGLRVAPGVSCYLTMSPLCRRFV